MEVSASSIATNSVVIRAVKSSSTDPYGLPTGIQQRLPSLTKLQPFRERLNARTNDAEHEIIKDFLHPDVNEDTGDLLCRLAIAQIVKDTDFPHEPIPQYVKDAVIEVLRVSYYRRNDQRPDILSLLRTLVTE
jgi:hypothetical protein